MKKNWKLFLFTGILLLALIISAVLSAFSGRIPQNDISVTGNTGGNLNNGGLFAESDGKVYFSNAYDGGCLYSMNADETEITRLGDSRVSAINTGGDYLYFYMDSSDGGTGLGYVVRTFGVYRSRLDGSKLKCLDRNAAVTMQLAGDHLYYQRYNNKDYTRFYKVKTDKSELLQVSEEIINPASCHNGIIYFNGQSKDHYLYALDTRTDTVSTIYQRDLWYPVYHEGYIYYMDLSSDYRLCRYSLTQNTVEILTTDRVDSFNVGNGCIYYQRNSTKEPALIRMGLAGENPEIVAAGNFENIQLTSRYAYFSAFGDDTTMYHTPLNGAISVSAFTAAQNAALENNQ